MVFGKVINNQVVDSAAIRKTELRVERLVNGEAGNIVGDEVLQERKRIRAFDFEFAHVTDIEKASMRAYRAVFFDDAGILNGHLEAAELYDARA